MRAFDLNQNSLAEGEYNDCEKTLAGDYADEPRRDRDGFLGKPPAAEIMPHPLPPVPTPLS